MKDVFITLRLRTSVFGLELDEAMVEDLLYDLFDTGRVANKITNVLSWWSDGRYSFNVEMIQSAVAKILENTIVASVGDSCRTLYGDEMVAVGPGSQSSKAGLVTDEICKNLRVLASHQITAVEVSDADAEVSYSDGGYAVICRPTRKEDLSRGSYEEATERRFPTEADAYLYAEGIPTSRHPVVVESWRLTLVLGALNTPAQ